MGGFQPWAQVTWLLLSLAVESPWSALCGPFLSSCARTGLETVFWPCRAYISGSEAFFSLFRVDHWPIAVTIASSLAAVNVADIPG